MRLIIVQLFQLVYIHIKIKKSIKNVRDNLNVRQLDMTTICKRIILRVGMKCNIMVWCSGKENEEIYDDNTMIVSFIKNGTNLQKKLTKQNTNCE